MGLSRYALASVIRNRRRTLSSILGVLLAITFIAGTFIAIDSSARATLDAYLANVQGDFSYYAGTYPGASGSAVLASNLHAALEAVPGVSNVSVYSSLTYSQVELRPSQVTYVNVLGIEPTDLPWMLRQGPVAGSLALPRGTVALSTDVASQAGLHLNDTVTFTNYVYNGTGGQTNYTLNLTVSALVPAGVRPCPECIGPPTYLVYSIAAINLADASWFLTQLNYSSSSSNLPFQGEIWIDRNRFVNPYDIDTSTRNLQRLERQLLAALQSTGSSFPSIQDNLVSALQQFQTVLALQRIQFFFLSLPVIFLGLYLGAVGVDLGHAERRRELAVLRTRGAGRREVVGLLILESVLGGLVAAILGLLLGIGLSRVLLGVVLPLGGASAAVSGISLTSDTLVAVAILSIVFMAIVSYRSAKRTAGLSILETLRYYAPGETRIHYAPTVDILLVAYSVATYAVVVFLRTTAPNVFFFLIAIIFIASLPVVPILMIIGVSRLATRSTGRVYEWAAKLSRPFSRNLNSVVSRNLQRNPRRASSVTIIIALGLGFGVLILSVFGSQVAFQVNGIRAEIGGDLRVSPGYFNGSADSGFGVNLSSVPGVAAVARATSIPITNIYSTYASVVALDPAAYFSVTRPDPFYFEQPGSAAGAQSVLATNGSVLVTRNLADAAALQIGDRILLSSLYYVNGTAMQTSATVTVGGIVRFLPGTFPGSFFGAATAPNEMYGSEGTFAAFMNKSFASSLSSTYIVAFSPGTDWQSVKAGVAAIGGQNIEVYQEQVQQLSTNPSQGSFLGFLETEIAFIGVILTAGLGLIIYAASLERDVEFAGIIARGASGWQAAGLLVAEAFSILVIGLVIGVAVGLVTGYLYATFLFAGATPGSEAAVPFLFVFPTEGFLLIVLAPAAMLITALAVSWRIVRMNVAQVLKMRGG